MVAAYVSPKTVFLFLLNSSGAIIIFAYLLICISELILRPRIPPDRLRVKMWFYPVLTLLTIAAMLGVIISMGLQEDTRSQLFLSLLSLAVVLAAYPLSRRLAGTRGPAGRRYPPRRVFRNLNRRRCPSLPLASLLSRMRRSGRTSCSPNCDG